MRLSYIVLNVATGLGLLALVVVAVDTAALARALGELDMRPVALALAIVQLQVLLSALRWRFTAARLGQRFALFRALAWYYEASFLNLVLPAGVLGDGFRAYRAAGETGLARALRAVVFERLSGQAAFLVLALGGLSLWPFALRARLPEAVGDTLAVAGFGVLAIAGAVAALALRHRVRTWLALLGDDLARCFLQRGAWAVQGGLSVLVVVSYVAVFALSAAAVGAPLPPVAVVTVVPLVLLGMLLPVSVGGWGVREAASAALWPAVGLAAADGVATALVYGFVALAGALPGALSLALAPGRAAAAASSADRRA